MTGQELKQARVKMKMTRRELARKLGVTETTLYRWETGRVRIQGPAAIAIAEVLSDRAGALKKPGD